MILVHPDFEHVIEFKENKITRLVIENPVCFRKYVMELSSCINGDGGDFVLSEDNSPLEMREKTILIRDPAALDFEQKHIQSKLSSRIKRILTGPDIVEALAQVRQAIAALAEIVVDEADVPISPDGNADAASLMKILSFGIDIPDEEEIMKLFDFLRINRELCGISIFFILNAQLYFTGEELRKLTEACFLEKLHLVFIEGRECGRFTDDEHLIIIDNDLCEIF